MRDRYKVRIGMGNIGTLTGKNSEVLKRRKVNIFYV
jgi:hypothetical protein